MLGHFIIAISRGKFDDYKESTMAKKLKKRRPNGTENGTRSYIKLTPRLLLKSIPGTGGIIGRIARNAGCAYNPVTAALKNPDKKWDGCREEFETEKERIGDTAEHTMQYLITQRIDFATARKSAEFILSRKYKERGYADESTLKIKSDNPLVQITNNQIDISVLDLPLKIKVMILEAIEKYQRDTTKLLEGKA